jgi:mannosyltransferase
MELLPDVVRRIPSTKENDEKPQDTPFRAEQKPSRLSFFRRRIRLKGNSTVSILLAIALLFSCLVIGLISTLFMRTPDTDGIMNMPAGTPPSIRYGPNCLQFELSANQL